MARVSGAVLACSAVGVDSVVPAAFLVAEVWVAARAVFHVAADYLEVAGLVSREDSLADSRVLVGYWAAAAVVVSPAVAYFLVVSRHSDSDAQAYSAQPPAAAVRSDYSRSDLACLLMGVRPPHPAH